MDTPMWRLNDVVNEAWGPLHYVTVLAGKAALVVTEKYQMLSANCELYDISIGKPSRSVYV